MRPEVASLGIGGIRGAREGATCRDGERDAGIFLIYQKNVYLCTVYEEEPGRFLLFVYKNAMDRSAFESVLREAVTQRGCILVDLDFDDDDNIFVVTIDRDGADVELADCEFVHRAILAAFDRDVEDYSLTVTSAGIDAEEADKLLESTKE